jgi:arsenate reductase (glutaredoxin)
MIVYYNPDCSKCREAVDLLERNSCDFEIREYLKEPPTVEELRSLVLKLRCNAFDIVRKSESLYIERYSDKNYTDDQWLNVLAENPVLIERPIVITGDQAIIGRPPSKVIDFISKKK